MSEYNHKEIEQKWQKEWSDREIFNTADKVEGKENEYILVEFAYPSGNLHVGHWYAFAVTDIYARLRRMQGKNVMFPIGFDAFGLPAENAAIKRGLDPKDWTYDNMDTMRKQLRSMGAAFDWSREVVTCSPEYYKWTQWIFTKFFEKGLAYQSETNVNWCPSCKTVLANEQVVAGHCERCDSEVEQRKMNQWQLKITDYADRLIDDLDNIDWPEPIKDAQRNWIGRSQGAKIKFSVKDSDEKIEVFTTRPDTLFGVTYMVLAPEHDLVEKLSSQIKNSEEVENYIKETRKKKEMDRIAGAGEKTGVKLEGVSAINPANGEEIPVFIADYVLASYGTGAIMAVPAHDERDNAFAKKFDLPIISVIGEHDELTTEKGALKNSGEFDGLTSDEATPKIIEKVGGEVSKNYRLRDWLVSRQRYWGCPIPIVHCEKCGAVPVPEKDLPIELPKLDNYLPREDGKSPLAKADDWVKTKCPKCDGDAERETDTLDTFVDSSWYFLRYSDANNTEKFADMEKLEKWNPVDFYSGGAEHTTMHLLFARFFNKALFDMDLVKETEPFTKRLNRALILGPDGNKMSKSKGNVIDPDEIVDRLGADTVRLYLSFIGPYNEVGSYPWDPNGVVGVRRFLEKVWRISDKLTEKTDEEVNKKLHKVIKRVTEEFLQLKFNAGIAQLMSLSSLMDKKGIAAPEFSQFLKLLSVCAPHISEELWQKIGNTDKLITESDWPVFDEKISADDEVQIIVQVNGKVRAKIMVPADSEEDVAYKMAMEVADVTKWLENNEPKKVIFVKNRILNLVV